MKRSYNQVVLVLWLVAVLVLYLLPAATTLARFLLLTQNSGQVSF